MYSWRTMLVAVAVAGATVVGARAQETGPAAGGGTPGAVQDSRPQYWYGVAVENLPPTIAKQLKLKADQGLMVIAVLPGTPAEKAGIKAEDLLIDVDGTPLTSQEDLARAANMYRAAKAAAGTAADGRPAAPKPNKITLLREGDRKTVSIMPALRPENMLVMGPGLQNFVARDGAAADPAGPGVRNIVLPNGGAAQVMPGYVVDLTTGDASTVTMQSLKRLVGKGETVVLSQEKDAAGNVKNVIVVGQKTYPVEPGKLETLPADLRPLAKQLLDSAPPAAGGPPAAAPGAPERPPAPDAAALEERLGNLERQNQALQQQIQDFMDLMKKQPGGGAKKE